MTNSKSELKRKNIQSGKDMMEGVEEYGKYWICEPCAIKKGGDLSGAMGITVIRGICSWCKAPKVQMIIPIRDFKWKHGRPDERDNK